MTLTVRSTFSKATIAFLAFSIAACGGSSASEFGSTAGHAAPLPGSNDTTDTTDGQQDGAEDGTTTTPPESEAASVDGIPTTPANAPVNGGGIIKGPSGAQGPVNLGSAGNYVILSKAGISTVPNSTITGNIAVSPAAATYITGFSLTADPTNVFSTAPQVIGKVFAADYAVPSPSKLTTAIGDMETAFTAAAARAPNVTELGAGNIGGKNLAPGVYNWSTGLLIPTNVTLTGSAKDVWVFQVAQTLTMASNTRVVLAGGALAKNVFWQVAGAVDLGTTSHCEGVILTKTAINLRTGASINGRLFAQTAVTIAKSTVTAPAN
ncbi:MAG: hypothetical protein JWM74_2251 [Myxococcaceae bacterium]|nr:hypothetical protein [Myxococcaceae bacterium]